MSSGQFILQEKLNESATTSVYKAHQTALERTVLLKILHKHLADDAHLVERFGREARACALIRSEHIVQVYDFTTIDGAPAIVMEFVEGQSLKDVLHTNGPMSREQTLAIAAETLAALQAAHERGVIHRDIKPGNILVTETGRIKVTDFGLAAIAASPTVTMEGAVLGTPAYLPPELLRGESADERSDLFSLGATLLEIRTGRRIFEGPTYSACIHKILQFDPAQIESMVTDAETVGLLKQLMHPDRTRRFHSASEALASLQGIDVTHAELNRSSVETRQPDTMPHAARSEHRKRSRLLLAAAALMLLVVSVAAWRLFHDTGAEPARPNEITAMRTDDSMHVARHAPAENATVQKAHQPDSAPPQHAEQKQPATNSAAAPTPSVQRDSSMLVITCIPWAKVFLDSQYLGETPIGGAIRIRSGMHTVSFNNPQFMPIVKTINARAGAQLNVSGNFLETVGYLLITVKPWAEIYIDDQYRETTPIDKPMAVTAGTRHLRLHNPGCTDAVYDVAVSKNDTLHLSYTLTRTK